MSTDDEKGKQDGTLGGGGDGASGHDGLDEFMKAGPDDEPVIDPPSVLPPVSPDDAFKAKVAQYQSKSPAWKERAESEENIDPVKHQRAREEKAEEDRKKKLLSQDVPEHMIEHVRDDAPQTIIPKGGKLDLLQKVPGLRQLYVGAGWTNKALDSDIDIDLSVFLLDKNDMTVRDTDLVFYNQLMACGGALKHEGDNRQGASEGDEEGIFIDLNGIPFDIVKIMIVISAYDELEEGFNLGQVRNMYVRLVNREYKEEICRFVLADEYHDNTAIYVAAIVRDGPRWIFETLGTGIGRGGLQNIATRYGIIVKELQSSG